MRIQESLTENDQAHLLAHLETLSAQDAATFSDELSSVEWTRVRSMHLTAGPDTNPPLPATLSPLRASIPSVEQRRSWWKTGREMLAQGRAGFVLMAGGQGSRLGFEGPKGACPLGLPEDLVLFEIQVRRLLRLAEICGKLPPFAIMTGPDNDEATRAWFANRHGEALPSHWPEFFLQSSAPALNDRGQALLSAPGRLALVPDGNGGIWQRLSESGILARWQDSGVEWMHVAGVDNLLSPPCDPVFLGFAGSQGQPLSVKSVLRTDPSEKVGVYVLDQDNRPRVAEYTELPADCASKLDSDDLPVYREANIASHLVHVDAVATFARMEMPWHLARKKIPHVDPISGQKQDEGLSCKYERFLFDAFPAVEGISCLRVERELEFAPVKNALGADSPDTARKALEAIHRHWQLGWGDPDPSGWVDPRASYGGERPGTRGEEASF